MERDTDLEKAITDRGLYTSRNGTTDDSGGLWAYYLLIGAIYNEHTPGSSNHREGELERIIGFAQTKSFVHWQNPP